MVASAPYFQTMHFESFENAKFKSNEWLRPRVVVEITFGAGLFESDTCLFAGFSKVVYVLMSKPWKRR